MVTESLTHSLTDIHYGALPNNLIQMKALNLKFVEYCNFQNLTFFKRFFGIILGGIFPQLYLVYRPTLGSTA